MYQLKTNKINNKCDQFNLIDDRPILFSFQYIFYLNNFEIRLVN